MQPHREWVNFSVLQLQYNRDEHGPSATRHRLCRNHLQHYFNDITRKTFRDLHGFGLIQIRIRNA